MVERSTSAQSTQIGREVTPGTAVPATRRLASLTVAPSVTVEVGEFRPQGSKFLMLAPLGKEWAEADVSGSPTYEEVVYPLCGAVGAPTSTQVMDGATPTGAYEHTFTPSTFSADAPPTFTLESGQAGVQAERYTHLLFTEFGMEMSREEISVSGSAFARRAETGFTPTAGLQVPTTLTPILPTQVTVSMASTAAGLGAAAALTRVVSVSPSISDRYNPAWFLNAVEQSFTTWSENPDGATTEVGLTLEADAVGMGLLNTLRAGDTTFLRVEAKGPVLYNAGTKPNLPYLFQWDMALKVTGVDTMSDEDGIYAIPWTLSMVHDATWGKAMQVMVRNKSATL